VFFSPKTAKLIRKEEIVDSKRRAVVLSSLAGIAALAILVLLLGSFDSGRLPVAQAATDKSPSANTDIVINEIMQNPSAVSDSDGEWFELYNAGSTDVDINGWTIADDDSDYHEISSTLPLTVPAGGYLVLGRNISITQNGGVTVAYEYSNIVLANNVDDELILTDTSGVRIDYVAWDDGATFPDPNGASMELVNPGMDNNTGANWCEANSQWSGNAGDKGSPGTQNTCFSDFMVEKSGPQYVVDSGDIVYTVNLNNQGNVTVTNVLVTDTLPMSVTYVSDDSGWTAYTSTVGAHQIITWAAGDLVSKTSTSFNLTTSVGADVPVGTVLTNSVEIKTDLLDRSDEWETAVLSLTSIYDLQYTTDPSGDSPYEDQKVATEGIVVANFSDWVFIQDGTGAWSGIALYQPDSSPAVGDRVRVAGTLEEAFGLTRFASGSSVTVLSSGNSLPDPEILDTGDVAQEQWESVLVRVENATVTDENLDYGKWEIDDGSGSVVVDDLGTYSYPPTNGDMLNFVQGPLHYSFGAFKIEPRDDSDIGFSELVISKDATSQTTPDDTFTYTLTIENKLGFDMSDVVITDTVPTSATFAYGLNGGVEAGGVVSWSLSSIANGHSVEVGFVVTATGDLGDTIVNQDYAVSASNYPTPTFGSPVNTFIGDLQIYHVQGDGDISPYLGQEATVEGIVVADFQGGDEMEGFFMQDAVGDGDTSTSDGIFVYATQVVSEGDWVEVTGTVDECYNLTQLNNVSAVSVISTGNTIAETQITLPEQTEGEIERYEGMLVTIPHTMTVAQNYFQGRYGQVTLSSGKRMYQPTHLHAPDSSAFLDQVDENARRMLVLDDGSSDQYPDPIPYIGDNNTLRAGDVVSAGLTGIIDNGPINSSSPPATDYRLHPTAAVNIARVNDRSAAPSDVGGRLKVASFNVLNYFNGDGMGGGFPTSRGADTLEEFNRQRAKIITAVLALDADVVGLMEIENDGYDANSAIQDLVDGLNAEAGAGTYAFIDPGVTQIGDDEIAVGLIYKLGTVTPVGSAAILDNTFDPDYVDSKNRPALAQTFAENATGEKFTAVVNHLKSKGSSCASIGDPDTGDGQGNCNLTRTSAMTVELSWLATDPTGSGDPDYLIIGDLNSYAQEDPIVAARNAGYVDLLEQYVGPGAYSYIFDGESGYLDYAMSNGSLIAQVTGATVWHINADEPSVIDYNTDYKSEDFYTSSAYRASDHDPVIVGLDLVNQTALTVTKDVMPESNVSLGGVVTYTVTIANDGEVDAECVMMTDTLPAEVEFSGWVDKGSASLRFPPVSGPIVWGPWSVGSGDGYTFVFTATVTTDTAYYGAEVTNPVDFTSTNAGSGSDEAIFTVEALHYIYLPLVARNN